MSTLSSLSLYVFNRCLDFGQLLDQLGLGGRCEVETLTVSLIEGELEILLNGVEGVTLIGYAFGEHAEFLIGIVSCLSDFFVEVLEHRLDIQEICFEFLLFLLQGCFVLLAVIDIGSLGEV